MADLLQEESNVLEQMAQLNFTNNELNQLTQLPMVACAALPHHSPLLSGY